MLSKDEWVAALAQLGFVKEGTSRTDGSHIRFHHVIYTNLFVGIDDHKNTKEMNRNIHKELVKAVTMVVWLQSKDGDIIDMEKAKQLVKKLPKELKNEILQQIKSFEKEKINLLLKIIPRRLLAEVSKLNNKITEQDILNYIK